MSERPLHKLLVIGVGSIGERHLRCFQATGRCETSFVEINDALRSTIARRYDARGFARLEDALAERPHAAVIATPAHLHVSMATALAEAGIHLLIEKPLSTSLDGAPRLCETVARSGVTAGVAYVLRHHPVLTAMREAIRGGRFGRPVELVAVCGQHFPKYRPAYRDIYYNNRATGGGAIQDALTHTMNLGEWLVGPIARLVADAAHQVLEGVEVEDTVHLLARQGDVLASYSLNQHQAPDEVTATVICEKGTARFESHRHRWRWMTIPGGDWCDEMHPPLERDTLFIAQANGFLDALEGRCPPRCTLDEGLHTLRANLAALASVESGQWRTV